MKKILVFIFILAMLTAAFISVVNAESQLSCMSLKPGDVNGDGDIDVKDAVLLAQYLAGWKVTLGGDSHNEVIDPAVEPTCTKTGLTEGMHCLDCGTVLVEQKPVPTKPHDCEKTVVPPTTSSEGYTLYECKDCDYEEITDIVPAIEANNLVANFNESEKTCVIIGVINCTEAEINIPSKIDDYTVVEIADNTFEGCDTLTSVTIPESVNSIGSEAFIGCNNLAAIEVAQNNGYYCDVNGILFTKNMKTIVRYPMGKASSTYSIPSGVTSVADYAFYKCSNLASITIPESVTSIGKFAFQDCSSLTDATISESVTSIGAWAFDGCSSLKSLRVTNKSVTFGDGAFANCDNLKTIYCYANSTADKKFPAGSYTKIYLEEGGNSGWSPILPW